MKSRTLTLGGLASVATIALAWSAFAADGDGGGSSGGERIGEWHIPVPPPDARDQTLRFHGAAPGENGEQQTMVLPAPPGGPGGPSGPLGGELTNGELNVQRDGEAVTLRLDHGEIAAADTDSITVAENDGNEVEIAVDDETEVLAGPFVEEITVEDLEQGDVVHVTREAEGAAEEISVLPEGPPQMFHGEEG